MSLGAGQTDKKCTPQAPLPKRFLVDEAWAILDNFSATKASLMAPQEGKIKAQGWPCFSFFGDLPATMYKDVGCHLAANAPAITGPVMGEICDNSSDVEKLLALSDAPEEPADEDTNDLAPSDDDDPGEANAGEGLEGSASASATTAPCDDSFCSPAKQSTARDSSVGVGVLSSGSKRSVGADPTSNPLATPSPAAKARRAGLESPALSPMEKVEVRSGEAAAAVAAAIGRLKAKQRKDQ